VFATFYQGICKDKYISIKHSLPIDFNVKLKVRSIKHKSKLWKFLWWINFIWETLQEDTMCKKILDHHLFTWYEIWLFYIEYLKKQNIIVLKHIIGTQIKWIWAMIWTSVAEKNTKYQCNFPQYYLKKIKVKTALSIDLRYSMYNERKMNNFYRSEVFNVPV
jgi:hypothetical protein